MSITGYSQTRVGAMTRVTATSDLAGTVYFHWYRDGVWVGRSAGSWLFVLDTGSQARIEAIDTTDPAYDPASAPPSDPPTARTLWWVRSLSGDTDHYRIEQQLNGGDWTTIATVGHDEWQYELTTERLDDLSEYAWRVTPVDTAGNDGTTTGIPEERIVRKPDAPAFAIAFDEGTLTVSFEQ